MIAFGVDCGRWGGVDRLFLWHYLIVRHRPGYVERRRVPAPGDDGVADADAADAGEVLADQVRDRGELAVAGANLNFYLRLRRC